MTAQETAWQAAESAAAALAPDADVLASVDCGGAGQFYVRGDAARRH